MCSKFHLGDLKIGGGVLNISPTDQPTA